jgi:hypothetical protein
MSILLVISAVVSLAYTGYQSYKAYQMRKRSEADAADAPSTIPYITESDVIPVVFGTVDIVGPAIVEATGPRQYASSEPELTDGAIPRGWEWNYVRVVLCHGTVDSISVYIDSELKTTRTSAGLFTAAGGKTVKQILFADTQLGILTQGAASTFTGVPASITFQGSSLRLPGLSYALVSIWRYATQEGTAAWSQKPQFPTEVTWRVQRINWRHGQTGVTGWTDAVQWESATKSIGTTVLDMNPSHILRELLTDRVWGMGLDEADIDDVAFAAAAQQLFDEDFGLSYLWARETSAADFALEILRHIDGLMYQEPTTGKYTLTLIRDGSGTLHDLSSQALIVSAPEYTRQSYANMASRVTVIYRSRDVERETSVTVHDQSLAEQIGDVPVTIRYDGIYSRALAMRVASRDLRRLSTPLATVRLSVRWSAGKDIRNGDRVFWSWPEYGVFGMTLRVVSVTYGEIDASSVTLELVQDIFAPLEAIYSTPATSAYTPPNYAAQPTTPFVVEMPFALRSFGSGGIEPAETTGEIMALVPRPAINSELHLNFALATGGVVRSTGLRFCETFSLNADVTFSGMGVPASPSITATPSFTTVSGTNYLCVLTRPDGTDEFVVITQTTPTNLRMERGMYDTTAYYGTIPSGTVIYVIGVSDERTPELQGAHTDGRTYVASSVVSTRALTRTSQDVLDFASATAVTRTMARRQVRPLCPGNTAMTFVAFTGTTLTWRRRNRLTDPRVRQPSADVEPEAGTTHRLIIEGLSPATGGVFVQVQDLTLAASATSYLYTSVQEDLDHKTFPGGAGNFAQVRMTLYTTRDGFESWQRQIRVRT